MITLKTNIMKYKDSDGKMQSLSVAAEKKITDISLTQNGIPADAKATGDELSRLQEEKVDETYVKNYAQPKGNYVKSVNGQEPDENGNVEVSSSGINIANKTVTINGGANSIFSPTDIMDVSHELTIKVTGNSPLTNACVEVADENGGEATETGVNLFTLPYAWGMEQSVYDGVTFTPYEDGRIHVQGTGNKEGNNNSTFVLALNVDYGSANLDTRPGRTATNGTYVISCTNASNDCWVVYVAGSKQIVINAKYGVPVNVILEPKIEEGTVATKWTQAGTGIMSSGSKKIYADASGNITGIMSDDIPFVAGTDGYVYSITYKTLEVTNSKPSSTSAKFDVEGYDIPILKLTGDISTMSKDNAVTLNYVYGERSGTCTLKWQGNSSLTYPKKNYTIKFDNAFEAKTGWGSQKKYVLKANYIDFSHARNIVAAKVWGKMLKARTSPNARLSALVNGGAIDGFPIAIVMNGKYIGVYTFNIPKDGWMFGMGDGTSEGIICADTTNSLGTTFKGEATIGDTNVDFSFEYAPDEDNYEWMTTSLNRLINACKNSDGTDLDTTVAQYLDWDSAIDYYIFNCLVLGTDMSTKNYLLATYDGVKWFFSPYDMDSTWGLQWDGKTFTSPRAWTVSFTTYAEQHRVMELIKKYKKDALKARYNHLRNGVLREIDVCQEFIDFIATIPKALLDEDTKIWKGLPSTAINNYSQISDFISKRFAFCDAEMEIL